MSFKKQSDGFHSEECALHTLSNYTALIGTALSTGYISMTDVDTLKKWRTDPSEVGEQNNRYMGSNSEYISRSGKISSGEEDVYYFLSDIRNFERFVPGEKISGITIGQDSAGFQVPMLGNISVKISEKVMYNKVVFTGNALLINDFSLIVTITRKNENQSEATVTLSVDLNPLFKMAAEKPIAQFLESVISGMENFSDWKNIT
jgi:hypothetical protein